MKREQRPYSQYWNLLVKSQPEDWNRIVIPKWSSYIPHEPTEKQQAFLWLDDLDAFFGGAVGGGKSDALLMGALQYVDIPFYNAVLLRDTFANLEKPEGLISRAHEWLQTTDARWQGHPKYRFIFPHNSTVSFSYLDGPMDHFNHQSAAYQFVGIDECVAIRENQALYMFSRTRKKEINGYLRDLLGLNLFPGLTLKHLETYLVLKEYLLRQQKNNEKNPLKNLTKENLTPIDWKNRVVLKGVISGYLTEDNWGVLRELYGGFLGKDNMGKGESEELLNGCCGCEYFTRVYQALPLRFRCASNPPQLEQVARGSWVKERYMSPSTRAKGRIYLPSKMSDNPYLDRESYLKALNAMNDPITIRQLVEGDWDIAVGDRFFAVHNLEIVDDWPEGKAVFVNRRWDLAASPEPTPGSTGSDPDYTVGLKGVIVDGVLYILHMVRGRWRPGETDEIIKLTTDGDGHHCLVSAEQEPGASGVRNTEHLRRLLTGYAFTGVPSTGDKIVRARPVAAWVNQGKVKLVRGVWNHAFIDELRSFPDGAHDDIVDALSGLYLDLAVAPAGFTETSVTPGIGAAQAEEFGDFNDEEYVWDIPV